MLAGLIGGVVLLIVFCVVETKVDDPMFRIGLFKNATFAGANLAGLLASIGRGGLQFMLIIWLQGIWLPLHGYSYADTPLWAGIYLLPLTAGFLVAGPLSGWLSDRWGHRWFSVGGLVIVGATFVGLLLLPVDFPYWSFALLITINGIGSGLFSSPNTSAVMGSVPADQRGVAAGMRGTFFNSGSALSIGVFFSLMIVGLASTLPRTLTSGLVAQGVPGNIAQQVGNLPPVGSLFAAFLGFNPLAAAARTVRRAEPAAEGERRQPHRQAVLPAPDLGTVPPRADRRVRRRRDHDADRRRRVADPDEAAGRCGGRSGHGRGHRTGRDRR